MIVLTTPEPTVRPPSRNHFTVLFTILSLFFLFFQRFCLLVTCGILIVSKFGAILEPAHFLHFSATLLIFLPTSTWTWVIWINLVLTNFLKINHIRLISLSCNLIRCKTSIQKHSCIIP